MFHYLIAADQIIAELEKRGFITNSPEDAIGLKFCIVKIIKDSIEGNVNYTEPTEEPQCKCGNGLECDLENQS